ncbi:asparaginase [Testudinibacter sp. TR-2022]|uniref:asparaginase n=1 Tax=Testudinibacter sp. TR-2022 TaxID=2585029 RepID=UPI00111A36EC|nr:asparaginase [Testudinibacter sp. TR-2022]TNH06367.1 asparaginase [Pasteurellaceae bacterium Phil11]TNH20903.1 asparaginase [Testudinibacter sp. TR-2022]TNH24004.1 asparaginase [Testudinibacter sp. TR-2022]
MQKKSVYIAYTGGTIGMKPSKCGYVPQPGFMSSYLNSLPELQRAEIPHFIVHEYDELIDSANMTPQHWQQIADDIKKHYHDYDAFIILHGTDTMAYTASALSFMLENLTKPVIVTGSQIPISGLRSDGLTNLLNALYLVAHYPIREVCLFFNNKLFRGNRSTKSHADGFDAFSSPNYPVLVEAGINIAINYAALNVSARGEFKLHNITPQPIGIVMLYPGISPDVIRNILQQPVNALILLTFGIGNAPDNPEILDLLHSAYQKGIIVLNLTQCFAGKVNMGGYATGNALEQVGVISGHDMTVEAALAKMHFLLSQTLTIEQVRQKMTTNLRGEVSL